MELFFLVVARFSTLRVPFPGVSKKKVLILVPEIHTAWRTVFFLVSLSLMFLNLLCPDPNWVEVLLMIRYLFMSKCLFKNVSKLCEASDDFVLKYAYFNECVYLNPNCLKRAFLMTCVYCY